MFIWGDEIEYFLRTKKNRFKIATVPSAVHLHPKSVNKNNYISFYNWKVPDVLELVLFVSIEIRGIYILDIMVYAVL